MAVGSSQIVSSVTVEDGLRWSKTEFVAQRLHMAIRRRDRVTVDQLRDAFLWDRVSERTIWRHIKAGRLTKHKVGGRVYISKTEARRVFGADRLDFEARIDHSTVNTLVWIVTPDSAMTVPEAASFFGITVRKLRYAIDQQRPYQRTGSKLKTYGSERRTVVRLGDVYLYFETELEARFQDWFNDHLRSLLNPPLQPTHPYLPLARSLAARS
jgi:hypothetical protein